ncbi:DUF5804 family protein [Halocatena pleomorpha]|uniref:Uncharacterized protein n=1 Tax=Halocatena pleomorpha TaxID=1785090 RepID=A0A3P3RM33_9EURY|nr:DUF5804 family protein [Halocatena pleomorpha]RRJ33463.1 hypothetical protein EIK79_01280 [Halocatena pleomorpha]
MTRVCLVGNGDHDLRTELLSRQTAREALATYELERPYANTVAIETISLGVAVSFCNDLSWYLARFAEDALILEPSVSETEWLSQEFATAIRDGVISPEEHAPHRVVYGVESDESGTPRLVDPTYTTVTDGTELAYDHRDRDDTLVVRVTESEDRP